MEKNHKKSWNRMSGIYDLFMKKDQKLYDELAHNILLNINPGERLLEIGTATGIISLLLAENIDDITAIDYSNKMIKIAKIKAKDKGIKGVKFEVGNAYNLVYNASWFIVFKNFQLGCIIL